MTKEIAQPKARSLREISAAIDANPNDADLYHELASVRFSRREFAGAQAAHLKGIELAPNDAFGYLYFATFLTFLGEYQKAMRCIDTAITLLPNEAIGYWCKGELGRKMGSFALANECFIRAVNVDGGDELARSKLMGWRDFVKGIMGKSWCAGNHILPCRLDVRTRAGQLLNGESVRSLFRSACNLMKAETIYCNYYWDDDHHDSEIDREILNEELASGEASMVEYIRFCKGQGLEAYDDFGKAVCKSAKRFNEYRWGQDVFSVVLPADEGSARELFERLVSFARENGLRIWPLFPVGSKEIDLVHPGVLPEAWYALVGLKA